MGNRTKHRQLRTKISIYYLFIKKLWTQVASNTKMTLHREKSPQGFKFQTFVRVTEKISALAVECDRDCGTKMPSGGSELLLCY